MIGKGANMDHRLPTLSGSRIYVKARLDADAPGRLSSDRRIVDARFYGNVACRNPASVDHKPKYHAADYRGILTCRHRTSRGIRNPLPAIKSSVLRRLVSTE